MSLTRQTEPCPDPETCSILGAREHWRSASGLDRHAHECHQLLYARSGVAHVGTAAGSWILPPTRAIWIEGGTIHAFRARRPVDVTILYIARDAPSAPDWRGCAVLNVSPLVRELIVACAGQGDRYAAASPAGHLAQVLLEQLAILPQAPVALPEPQDSRAVRVADLLRADLTERRSLRELAIAAGASPRTVERLFADETGMSFGAWRVRHKMVNALELLGEGRSVGDVAFALGYETSSSFIAAFRKAFDTTPSRYFDRPGGPHRRIT